MASMPVAINDLKDIDTYYLSLDERKFNLLVIPKLVLLMSQILVVMKYLHHKTINLIQLFLNLVH